MNTVHLVGLLEQYKALSSHQGEGDQTANATRILELIAAKPDTYWQRSEFDPGHITASAWVVNSERAHALLVHHLQMDRLLQLGGHVEAGDADIFTSAVREVKEESGLVGSIVSNKVFHIDIHVIPARPSRGEPEHSHYDIRFMVEVPYTTPTVQVEESASVAWYALRDVESLGKVGKIDYSTFCMAQKTSTF